MIPHHKFLYVEPNWPRVHTSLKSLNPPFPLTNRPRRQRQVLSAGSASAAGLGHTPELAPWLCHFLAE